MKNVNVVMLFRKTIIVYFIVPMLCTGVKRTLRYYKIKIYFFCNFSSYKVPNTYTVNKNE